MKTMTRVTSETLAEKCKKYVRGSLRIGGMRSAEDLSNKLIERYNSVFKGYQVIRLNDGRILSMTHTYIEGEKLFLCGKETKLENDEIVYGECLCAEIDTVEQIEDTLIKMLFSIKSISRS
jgi:hypothetical protein